ncbi:MULTISPECIES: very short patch repair endonuclease [unclassified Brevundimonas]|uniref:very short patch repair endonuclease n=1 Tax=unclassified Brevundimonas TaxID=2622653 RepID=UPI000CFB2C7D|nr:MULTISPECIES: DNA mismatch endonuclease Vsr [unclassified Brevundimonas]PRA27173.1 very short patch repair endonuclease [Brevundimonas sp. MYb27]PQZ77366.1 very short patch repair endonuclease [Brevundimonas sp. MYb31]PRB17590.1 very short patch repair endonuclease [Brevundimonas sp. MYb52]PRB37962.1 very short patch repair endonuclease [Brevundimonas sp. MYb46]PRB46311.1 very short patch repair endonuclease [Brevundimonas sp. MYb33]
MDKLDPERRSANMARVRGKDTGPEMRVRRIAHRIGLRFRLHRKDLPGKPDLVFPKHRLVVFVHGCFWHRHPGCNRASTPATRPEFWQAKFEATVARDNRQQQVLEAAGWKVLVLWECGLKDEAVVERRLREAIAA